MINANNASIHHLLATLKQHHATGTLAQGPTVALADALALTMQDTQAYAVAHSGVASTVAPSVLVAAFHPHVLADALALLRIVRGEKAPPVQVYTDTWKPVEAIPVNAEDIARFDVAWAKPAPAVPAPPPPAPAPPAPPVPQPPAAPATLAVPDSVLAALAAVEGLTPVHEAEHVQIPTTGKLDAIIVKDTGQPLPVEKEHAGPAPVPVVAQEPTRWYPGIPAPADIAPASAPGKGRPKLSPFAKAHPPRQKVGSASPFWRDLLPMAPRLFTEGPANCPPDNTLGTLESFTQLVHVVRTALQGVDNGTQVRDVKDWLDDVWSQISESPAYPAIEHSLEKYNAQGEGK